MADTWEDGTPRTPVTICWHCDRPLDAASGFGPTKDMVPEQGAVSLCMYCGAVAIFGPDLILYPPSREELDGMEDDKNFMNTYFQFAWARQYVMIKHSLLRGEGDPDR